MQIAHIFNDNKTNNNSAFIDYQPFDTRYFENQSFKEKVVKNITDEYSKLYYEALEPISDKSIISKYDDEKLNSLVEQLGEDILMISGDFWGIQKFIFDGLNSSKAAKILRSRSAMVQLITYVVADMVKKEFAGSDMVLFGAGKFMIFASYESSYQDKLQKLQKCLDNYFLQNFFGQTGFILSSSTTTKTKVLHQSSNEMQKDLENLAKDNELKKLQKFNFLDLKDDQVCIDIFDRANSDESICPFCSKRVAKESVEGIKSCSICANQIALGSQLVKSRYLSIFADTKRSEGAIILFETGATIYQAMLFDSKEKAQQHSCKFNAKLFDISDENYTGIAKWALGSYAPSENKKIKTFDEIAKNSSGLMALKADVDRLGDIFRNYYMKSFKKFNRLSRELDFFFSSYVSKLIRQNYPNCYIVFAGGDDLYLIGEYKEVVTLAKEVREKFYNFSLQKATLSMGLVMFKPSTSIQYISSKVDEAESRAKEVASQQDGSKRNGIDIFGISMKFDEFLKIENEFAKIVTFLESKSKETTSFYFKLLQFCDMSENVAKDPQNAMWRSKLHYFFRRNISNADEDKTMCATLEALIEHYKQKLQPTLFLKIYANRDKTKGETQ